MAKKVSKAKTRKSARKRPSVKRSAKRPIKRSAKRSVKRPTKRSAKKPSTENGQRPARAAPRATAPPEKEPLSALEERLMAVHRGQRGGKYATELVGEYSADHVATAYDRLVQRGLLRRYPEGSATVEGVPRSLYALA